MVLASAVVTVVIIVAAVVVLGVLLVVLGPLSRPEQLRDDVGADTVSTSGVTERSTEEVHDAEGYEPPGDPEERLDRENE